MNIINRNNKKDDENENIMNGILLLTLAITGGYIKNTLGCQLQKFLDVNIIARNLVIIFIIYFSIGFTSKKNINPFTVFKNALIIWVLYILYTKISLGFNIIVFILIAAYHIINNYIEYYEEEDPKKNKELIELLNKILDYLLYIIIGLTIIGFILYFNKQRTDYSKNWSTSKFLFGTTKCSSIK
jgi:hypothetical protein